MNQTFQTVVQLPSFVNENGVNGTNCVSGAGEGADGVNLAAIGRAGCSGGDMGAPNRSVSMLHLTNGGCVLSTVPLFHDMDDNRLEART
jgi:hypothetical protein